MRGHIPELIAQRLDAIVFYALLALIALTAIPYGTVEPLWEAVFECAVFGLAVLSIIEITINRRLDRNYFGLILPLLALLVFALIQTISFGAGNQSLISGQVWQAISADPFQTRRWIIKMLALIITGAMLLRYTSNERRLRLLIGVILITGVASALFGLFRQTAQREKGFLFLNELEPGLGYAQFINKNSFAFLAEMALGLTLGVLVGERVKKERALIYMAVSLPLWAALVLSNSRGGLFSLFGQLLFLAMMWTMIGRAGKRSDAPRSRLERLKSSWPIRMALLCSLLLFVLIGTVWMGGDLLVSRLQSVSGEISATKTSRAGTSRAEIWRSTGALIKDHVLTGVGFGGYWAAIPQYHQASGGATPQEAHNDYLELMASGGMIGLALALWFMVVFINRARKVWRTSTGYRKAASLGALTALFGVAIHSLVDFGLHITINALVLTALLVIATVDTKSSEASQS